MLKVYETKLLQVNLVNSGKLMGGCFQWMDGQV